MFSTIKIIATGEFRSLLRQKTFSLLLTVFLFMSVFSAYIGLSTKTTINNVYNETVKQMVAAGVKNIPTNPFLNAKPLAILNNMVVYILVIGALLGIVVGYSAFIRERKAGVFKILFSKPISKYEFILGKMAGTLLTMALVVAVSFVISLVSTSVVSSHILSLSDTVRLLLFYAFSLGYIFVFSMIGLFFAAYSRSESLALLAPVVVWILISFAIPQLNSAVGPTALLNPTSSQAKLPQSQFFTTVRAIVHPFSISEDFKSVGRSLLQGDISSYPVLSLLMYLTATTGGCFYIMKKYDVCAPESDT